MIDTHFYLIVRILAILRVIVMVAEHKCLNTSAWRAELSNSDTTSLAVEQGREQEIRKSVHYTCREHYSFTTRPNAAEMARWRFF